MSIGSFLDALLNDPEPEFVDGLCSICSAPAPHRRHCDRCAEVTHGADYSTGEGE